MKILLIAPCPKNEQRHETMAIPQLTLSLIAGMTPPEHEVKIIEEVYNEEINYDEDVDVVGISIMTQTCIRGYEIANEFKKREKTVIFGGIHASTRPYEAILYCDALVIGEAEGLWEIVLNDIKNNCLKQFYKLDKFPDLQQNILPRRDLIQCQSGKFSIAPVETSRGCPYNCDFCTVSKFFGTKQRHKPIESVIKDAEMCNEKFLFFLDDNITGTKKYARKLFQELIHLNKLWVGQASINLAKDPELMKLAYRSGCRALLIGFESMSEDGIGLYRKTLKTIEENITAVKKLRNNGIMTMASLVFGLDTDTEEIFDLSHEFLTKAQVAFFQACILTPYPGTPVFDKLKEEGRILTDDWRKYDATKVLIAPKKITPEKLLDGYSRLRKSIYSGRSVLQRALPNCMIGPKEAFFYFSLNRGYHNRNNGNMKLYIHKNSEGSQVDFNMDKYVKPVKEKKAVLMKDMFVMSDV